MIPPVPLSFYMLYNITRPSYKKAQDLPVEQWFLSASEHLSLHWAPEGIWRQLLLGGHCSCWIGSNIAWGRGRNDPTTEQEAGLQHRPSCCTEIKICIIYNYKYWLINNTQMDQVEMVDSLHYLNFIMTTLKAKCTLTMLLTEYVIM